MIELDRLVKKFGDLVAVNDISLKIARGEFFAMLGPNAAGKTTTIFFPSIMFRSRAADK